MSSGSPLFAFAFRLFPSSLPPSNGHTLKEGSRTFSSSPPEAKKEIDEAGVDIESVADFG